MAEKLTIRVKKSVSKSSVSAAMSRFDHWVAKTPCLDAKPHQRDGVKWCLTNELKSKPLQGVRGGLVADEMGLGKTYTMIGTIVANRLQRTLIVLPLALCAPLLRSFVLSLALFLLFSLLLLLFFFLLLSFFFFFFFFILFFLPSWKNDGKKEGRGKDRRKEGQKEGRKGIRSCMI